MSVSLPPEKMDRLRRLLADWIGHPPAAPPTRSHHDAQSLLGHLMHAVQILPDGKIFCDRLISLIRSWSPPFAGRRHISSSLRMDLSWWQEILVNWSGRRILPHLDWEEDLQFFTDASGSLGAGGLLGDRWWCLRWSAGLLSGAHRGYDIFWAEMFAIWVSLLIWGPSFRGRRIVLHCDNQACVASLASGRARHHPTVNELIRRIVLLRLELGFDLRVDYVDTADNPADSLSRLVSLPSPSLQEPLPGLVGSLYGFAIASSQPYSAEF
jgi:hypothetical protein